MKKTLQLLTAALMLGTAIDAEAQNLIVGQANSGNCYPFICLSADARTNWQQVYNANQFGSNPVNITGIYFFSNLGQVNPGATWDDVTFTLSLSTTTAGFPLNTNGAANIGANQTQIFTGTLSGFVPTSGTALSFAFAPFAYDPNQGNLLLDVQITPGGSGQYGNYLDADYTCDGTTERYYGDGSQSDVVTCGGGLQTGFDVNRTSTVPEPSTYVLMAAGLAGIVAVRRRRKSA